MFEFILILFPITVHKLLISKTNLRLLFVNDTNYDTTTKNLLQFLNFMIQIDWPEWSSHRSRTSGETGNTKYTLHGNHSREHWTLIHFT